MFEHSPKKRMVQEISVKDIGGKHTATILLGPNPGPQVALLRKYVTSHNSNRVKGMIYGYDTVHQHRSKSYDVKCFNEDIYFAQASSFMDIDLCNTFMSSKYLIYHLFHKQQQASTPNRSKVFMCTFSLRDNRGNTIKDIVKGLTRMLEREVIVEKKKKVKKDDIYVYEYPIHCAGYNLRMFTYHDTSPMITIQIRTN